MNLEKLRKQATQIFQAGIDAANPYEAVKKHFVLDEYFSKIHIIALEKLRVQWQTRHKN